MHTSGDERNVAHLPAEFIEILPVPPKLGNFSVADLAPESALRIRVILASSP